MKLKGSEKDKENAQMHALIGTICQIKNKQTPVNITAWQFYFDHCYQIQVDVLSVVIPRKGLLSKFSGKTLDFGEVLRVSWCMFYRFLSHNSKYIVDPQGNYKIDISPQLTIQQHNAIHHPPPPPHLVFILNYKYQVNTLSFSHKDTIKQALFYYCMC